MGGDNAPAINIDGAVAAVRSDGLSVILAGDEAQIVAALKAQGAHSHLGKEISIEHTDVAIAMDDKPSAALRQKKNSSMHVACNAVKEGRASAALSAGNSGAMMAVALMTQKRLKGVIRPCIATPIPAQKGFALLVDAGANNDCTPEMLAQFGIMGSAYLSKAYDRQSPSIGVVANGTEATKGTDLTRATCALLEKTDLEFQGHVEPYDLISGNTLVGVTDGYTGNIMLKTGEGSLKLLGALLRESFHDNGLLSKIGGLISKRALAATKKRVDPREFGGAPLLGLRAPVFIAHGSSDAYAIRRGIGAAHHYAQNHVTDEIAKTLANNPLEAAAE